ncbi:MAG: KpsF/GutQ family sugar-phosphate isomerase [bacterium]
MTSYKQYALDVIKSEAEAVAALADKLNGHFDRAVEAIQDCQGRVIVAGIGKSGLIGKKIAATFNSVGVASFFLHPVEAMHGDLGLMQPGDLLLIISKSGRLEESELIVSTAGRLGLKTVALCGTVDSELWQRADVVLDCSVAREACPNNLVPTSSTTAALVMGDALAVALLSARNFSPSDFANLHPGGFLGTRLLKRVSELHHGGDELPIVANQATMPELLLQMTSKRLGCVVTTDSGGRPSGIFTDGDLRRLAEKPSEMYGFKASQVVRLQPKTIFQDALIESALAQMEQYSISQLVSVDAEGKLAGIIHLHDILKSKLV